MTVALLTRATFGLSVLHDRAPLFVRCPTAICATATR